MDPITRRTLTQLDKLEQDLRACQRRLARIGQARVPVYFGVPFKADEAFAQLYNALHDMRHVLTNHPEKIEG